MAAILIIMAIDHPNIFESLLLVYFPMIFLSLDILRRTNSRGGAQMPLRMAV